MPGLFSFNRRNLLIGTAAATVTSLPQIARPATGDRAPNIIFILADDLGYADVSIYGRPDLSTPNIDGIGLKGARLLQAYANSAVCSATRTALLTGRYQYRERVGLEEPIAGNIHVGLPPQRPTLPSLLKKAGYTTTLIGKWHLGTLPDFGPLQSGYDHFYGFRGGAVDYYSHKGTDDQDDLWDQDTKVHQTGYLTELLGDRAIETINASAKTGQPFFISLHFNAPHWPWEAPGDEAESARVAGTRLFDFDGGSQATYRGMIAAMDLQIGRIVQALQANGISENTIVIFTSDNGGERFADTWPFTGRKTELLEGGLRIPALVSWPARIKADQTIDQVSISMDWLPTLLAAAGSEPDPNFPSDGINLLPFLSESKAAIPRKLFWRYKANAQRAVRDGDYKYLKIRDNDFLFNVVDDPLERVNLKERHKDIYNRLLAEWLEWNSTMLPEITESFTHGFTGHELADHYGVTAPTTEPDNPAPLRAMRRDD
ncbi:sulfatase family protein [Beijerinckia indica]|uniref:Sulfatase n=1 Tax=Beijerinckia indica subsp. indica (strain ATCC 9039 / DSM 1715 / NCIMB 8712) TaxID=395963 RepID=B2IF16_BEII9|nr:sulfatase-like hydrolase/transferase [Beijerinckia indica]ACB94207.1 sulfatase [Beijerinckia indica subsp. indica ATCC 9039]